MKKSVLFLLLCLYPIVVAAQHVVLWSPNQKTTVSLYSKNGTNVGEWFLRIDRSEKTLSTVRLGLSRSDQDFQTALKFLKAGKTVVVRDDYTALHGKRSHCSNTGNELVVSFENPTKARMNLIVRAYNDGIAFRYEFPEKTGRFVVNEEFTAYSVASTSKRWLEKWIPSNENLYLGYKDDNVQQEWGYPALFQADDSTFFLLHEADVNRNYCGTKLSNKANKSEYVLTFPDQKDGNGMGESNPTITLPWRSPWRVVVAGSLATIVESTLVDDVCPPTTLKQTDWIQPGIVSWNYWSDNHGTKDFKTVCRFADLAATMGWPYTLLDWEWDAMGNGGNLEDAVRYIRSKGIKPLIWYNSGGKHNWVGATPKDRMLTHENRMVEFDKLQKLGVCGVKIDFFESEKQDMIAYYQDILEDAATYKMLVYFHGCLVPRGWARTYPHLMTYEGIRGAEWYNNVPDFTYTAPQHNTIVPFTRNVVGAMDYTPVTFTNSQHPHATSFGHELALSVVFESGLQHFADRPEGYLGLPDAPKDFLKTVPAAWDDTRLLDGYPGQDLILARRKGTNWFVGGINGEDREKVRKLRLDFLTVGTNYRLILIKDGVHDKALVSDTIMVSDKTVLDVRLLRRGGFAARIQPL
jgi:hypothetical protein